MNLEEFVLAKCKTLARYTLTYTGHQCGYGRLWSRRSDIDMMFTPPTTLAIKSTHAGILSPVESREDLGFDKVPVRQRW